MGKTMRGMNPKSRILLLSVVGVIFILLVILIIALSTSTSTKISTQKENSKQEKVTKINNPQQLSNEVGLGDSKEWVDSHLGYPSTIQNKKMGEFAYTNDTVQVTIMNGRVYYFEKDFTPKNEITLSKAKTIAETMIPKDAAYTGKRYKNNNGGSEQDIYVYKSELIKKLWSPDMFSNKKGTNQPGIFDIAYSYDTLNNPNKIMGITVFASDNP